MRFFRRGGSEPSGADFWGWWTGARDRIANAIETQTFDAKLVDEITRAVKGVDPGLAWEFGSGRSSRHALSVTPEGNPEVRPAALRWLASAPPPDAVWEYHASRQSSASARGLEIGGIRFDLDDTRAIASWDVTRRRVDVRLWHPGFEGAPEPLCQQVCFLFLDSLLGEDDVERWIGHIEPLAAASGGRTPEELKAEVVRRAQEPAGNTWILGQRQGAHGATGIVLADAALKRIDHPFADQHVALTVVLEGGGMPDDALAAQLNAEEDRLAGLLAGAAVLAGRDTSPGERVIHFVAEDLVRVRAGIDAWAATAPKWRVKVDFQLDPGWEFQRELGVR